jgi:hypothetical protein
VLPDAVVIRAVDAERMHVMNRVFQQLQARPLLVIAALAGLAVAVNSAGALDGPVLAYLGNNPGNQGRN